jgi:hypothetical protein
MEVVLLLVTILGSILVTWLLPMAFKSEPPYGVAVDIGAGTVAAVIWALVAFLVISPLIGLRGAMAMILSAGDAMGLAAVILWVLRRIKG